MAHFNHAWVISTQALKTRRRLAMDYEALLKLTDQIIEERRAQNGQPISHKLSRNQEDECKSQKENLKVKRPLMSYEELLKLTDQIIEEKRNSNRQRVSHKPPYDHEAERKLQRPVLKVKQTPMDYEALLDLAKQIQQEPVKTSAQVKKPKPLLAISQKRKLEDRQCIKEVYERRDPEWVGSDISNERRDIANSGYVPTGKVANERTSISKLNQATKTNPVTTRQTSSSKHATALSKPPTSITKIKKRFSSSTKTSKLLQKDVERSTAKRLRIEDDDSNMDDSLKDEKRRKALTKKRRL